MPKKRAERNRTLDVSPVEAEYYSRQTLKLSEIKSQSLDLSQIKNLTLVGDFIENACRFPNSLADLIFIDPPYNIQKNFHGVKFSITQLAEYRQWIETWLPDIIRILKPNGSLYLCGDWRGGLVLQEALLENQLNIINRITWQREKGRGASKNWKNSHEDIWFAVKNKQNYYFNPEPVKIRRRVIAPYRENSKPKDWEQSEQGNFRNTYASNLWDDLTVPFWSMPENTDHPTQKPEKLLAKVILASCPPEGVVFDPFLGSGTTSVVASKLGRQFVGVELNPMYAALTQKRLELATANKSIQGYADGVFWERNSTPS